MSIPFFRLVFDPRTADTNDMRRYREIENHYHVETIAENTQQLVQFQAASLSIQAKAAAQNLTVAAEEAKRQNRSNDQLAVIAKGVSGVGQNLERMTQGFERLGEGVSRIREGVDQLNNKADAIAEGIQSLNETAAATLDAILEQTEVIREGFETVAKQMLVQQKTLLDIAKTLRRPYEAQVLELREHADRWLNSGMRNTGRERNDDFTDSMKLLQEVVKNPIGNQDYVAWFQIGWLLWKNEGDLGEAENAFYRATRLSAPSSDQYHILAVRHFAYMQYLQGRFPDAYQTIQKVLTGHPNQVAPFDAARYAAKIGRRGEALKLLEQCIDLQPTTIITMFAEEDFK